MKKQLQASSEKDNQEHDRIQKSNEKFIDKLEKEFEQHVKAIEGEKV